MNTRILIAGLGNIFFGDDGFGCEVAQRLARRVNPTQVRVIDFGIRSYDLAYTLTAGFDVVIMVDAMVRGQAPGTLTILEPELNGISQLNDTIADAHSLDPFSVLQMAKSIGPLPNKLLLVACEPAVLESDEIGLSEPVRAAVPQAIAEIESLIATLTTQTEETNVCLTVG